MSVDCVRNEPCKEEAPDTAQRHTTPITTGASSNSKPVLSRPSYVHRVLLLLSHRFGMFGVFELPISQKLHQCQVSPD